MSEQSRPGLAALWMLGAIISFTAMAVAGREAGLTFDTFEIMTYRSAIGIVIVTALAFALGKRHQIRRTRLRDHGLRNIAHFTGQNLWFYAVTAIPLAQVFALEFTMPLWVILLAALFLGERLTWAKGVAGAMGFVGVLMVLQPGTSPMAIGHLAAAAAALAFAITALLTKSLTRTEPILTIMFWLTAMQLVFGIVAGLAYDGGFTRPQGTEWVFLLIIALAGLTAHFSLTNALSLAPASVVTPIDFIRLPAIALVGMVFYDEPLSLMLFAGAALIFGANYLNIVIGQRSARKPRPL